MSMLTVKNIDADVLRRLAVRAEAEGRSVQDLAREQLARAAELPARQAELAARREGREPMSWEEFQAFRRRRAARAA